jgi:hypothetical protein
MKRLPKVLINTSVAIAALALGVMPASAQPAPGGQGPGPAGWGPGTMMGPGMMGGRGFGFMCNPRAAGLAEWRLARIEAAVHPTDSQRAALNELRSASTKAAEQIAAACKTPMPDKPTERLAAMESRLEAMLQAVKTVRPAFDGFYATLDEQQKARLNATGPRRWGWGHWPWTQ